MARDFSRFSVESIKNTIKSSNNQSTSGNWFYPFSRMPFDTKVIIRFLPDKNEDNNRGFYVSKYTHKLEINGKNETVPCLKNWNEECPICNVSAQFYKSEGKKSVNGKKYWRKQTNIVQVLVVEDPTIPTEEVENATGQVKLMTLTWDIWKLVMEGYDSGELEIVPFAYEGGTDFVIKKTKNGEWAEYGVGTKFLNKSRDLTEAEIELVESQIVDLSTTLPQKPELEKLESMLNAALTGELYDDGTNDNDDNDNATDTQEDEKPVAKKESTTSEQPKAAVTKSAAVDNEDEDDDDEFMAKLKRRKMQNS